MDPLTRQKRALLALRLRQKSQVDSDSHAVVRTGDAPWYELSSAQRRLWFLERFQPGTPLYNVPLALRVTGPLDANRLRMALDTLVSRHEVLRTTFPVVEDGPVQVIAPAGPAAFEIEDLRNLDDSSRAARVDDIHREQATGAFDLATGPLLRTALVRTGDAEYLFYLVAHHIVCDGWSLGILWQELAAAYAGQELPAAPDVRYVDYAAWQNQRLDGGALEHEVEYWKAHLAHLSPSGDLSGEGPSVRAAGHGRTFSVTLGPSTTANIRLVARRVRASVPSVLMAALWAYLFRATDNHDVALGYPVAGRTSPELSGLVGFFVNTLVARGHVERDATFADLVAQAQSESLNNLGHQELPFDRLVEILRPERGAGRTPFFRVMLAMQNVAEGAFALNGLKVEEVLLDAGVAKFDLTLHVQERESTMGVRWEYDTDVFDQATAEASSRRFCSLLDQLTANPDAAVGDATLLLPQERELVTTQWNQTIRDYPRDATIVGLFLQVAAKTPERTAVVTNAGPMSYGVLASRVASVAAGLRERGVSIESPVGVCLERSEDMVVAVLAVLMAGGCYVPLDPELPAARLRFIHDDTGASLVLTEKRYEQKILSIGASCALLEDMASLTPVDDVPAELSAGNLAYISYTSGSTGFPKGVAVTHRNVVRLVHTPDYVDLGPECRVLMYAPLAFDASTFELWAPLLHGGQLVVAPPGPASLAELAQTIQRHRVDTLWLTAGLFHQMIDDQIDAFAHVKQVLAGGDVVSPTHVAALRRRFPALVIVNGYGPTEGTTFSTCHVVGENVDVPVPIGRPVPNARVYVLDSRLQPVPPQVVGELYVAGDGLARGYWRAAAATADRFIPDPFASSPGQRLYSTGDRVRWVGDGTLQFLGRGDNQVKVRGHRIELGEIEAVLSAHPAVLQSLVVAQGELADERRILAYFTTRTGHDLDVKELRRFTSDRLPSAMVPSAWVELEDFPLTSRGKVDRMALPDPEDQPRVYVAPAGETQVELASLWSELLSVERVGAEDDFFAQLGGHSLLATRVVSRVEARWGVDLPLREFFARPTVAALAQRIEAARGSTSTATVPEATRLQLDQTYPVSFAQKRMWFLRQWEPDSAFYHVPLLLHLEGAVRPRDLLAAMMRLAQRHEILRTVFTLVDGEPRQRVVAAFEGTVEAPDSTNESLDGLDAWLGDFVQRPFDLEKGPLVRLALAQLSPDECILALCLHHIVCDGWSLAILLDELGKLVAAEERSDSTLALPPPPLQFRDFARWQNQRLDGGEFDEQLSYWKQQLAPPLSVLQLPTDRPRPLTQTFAGATTGFSIDATLGAGIASVAKQHQVTEFMLLVGAFATLLHRYAHQDEIVVGTPVANRNRLSSEGVVGPLINTLALRVDLAGSPSFEELLDRVGQVAREAFDHQDIPFERLVEELQPQRDLAHTPIFQAVLVLQNMPLDLSNFAGRPLRPLPPDTGSAKQDVTLRLIARADAGFDAELEYNRDLFDEVTVRRMGSHFVNLLGSLVAQPNIEIGCARLTSPWERHRVLEWNRSDESTPPLRLVHECIREQSQRTPDAVAISFGDREISYREMDRRSNALAQSLSDAGVGPETSVGLWLDRGPDLVIALLGVLKSGGGYVPLDAAHPAARQEQVLEDAGVSVVVVGSDWDPSVAPGRKHIQMPTGEEGRDDPPRVDLKPSNLAYTLFTSGSTGRPKGVAVEHSQLYTYVVDVVDRLKLATDGRFAMLQPLTVDSSVTTVFPPLMGGGELRILSPDASASAARVRESFEARRPDVLKIAPSHLHVLTAGDPTWCALPRRVLIVGGEEPGAEFLGAIMAARPDLTVFNHYGPTETTVGVCAHEVSAQSNVVSPVSLGRVFDHSRAYVLDAALQPVPVGVAGELYIGGGAVARGYVRRPGSTAERFVPDPFSRRPGERMYRTGDLVRWRANGELVFMGRADAQISLRGMRIEPGEIEGALLRHDSVGAAVVVVHEFGPDDQRLVAYVVSPAELDKRRLREHLRAELPLSMVPSVFVRIEEVPRTPHGKLNRRALPDPTVNEPADSTSRVVSIDGTSLDLSQVEIVLLAMAGVRQARAEMQGEPPRLVVSLVGDATQSTLAIRGHLRQKMGLAAVPAHVQQLDELPPLGQDAHAWASAEFEAPFPGAESAIAEVWCELLSIDRVGRRDTFLDLGGHSLLAIRMIARVEEKIGHQLSLREVFANSLAQLASTIGDAGSHEGTSV